MREGRSGRKRIKVGRMGVKEWLIAVLLERAPVHGRSWWVSIHVSLWDTHTPAPLTLHTHTHTHTPHKHAHTEHLQHTPARPHPRPHPPHTDLGRLVAWISAHACSRTDLPQTVPFDLVLAADDLTSSH
jgi:hypothetical protein